MHESVLTEILEALRRLEQRANHLDELLRKVLVGLRQIAGEFEPVAQSLIVTFEVEGMDMGQAATIHVKGNGAKATFTEFDGPGGTGNKVPPTGIVSFASDNPAVATVDANGNIAAVSAGVANISATDAGNSLTDSAVLTVTAAPAISAKTDLTANP